VHANTILVVGVLACRRPECRLPAWLCQEREARRKRRRPTVVKCEPAQTASRGSIVVAVRIIVGVRSRPWKDWR